ncbi:Uncharacterised protein [Megamonas hypermegale]|uniref:Uncharacterized protein n=1 Tax=Megamonas hypermegale TaxID=158847 RepID=A0A378NUB0_9FIRM|nr:hypothetical protein [Megamonas hypermegale]STY71456.1 Uncharacterised protein [Megamonas hypermegale]
MDSSNIFLTYVIPIVSACIAYRSYKLSKKKIEQNEQIYILNKKQIEQNKQNFHINEVKKVFPCIISETSFKNEVKICNKSDYPIFDIVVAQGINTMNINEGEINTSVKYIRTILPKQEIVLDMENKGMGMKKFLVVGIFFRDYLGKEWFKDSYGKFEEVQDYKKMLVQKKILFPPYDDAIYRILD